jgi:methylmalonyl-CoA/ethylmalonyl-CoA epimerase
MIKGIGHIGIAVKDLQETLSAFSKSLGISIPLVKDVPERGLRVAIIDIAGIGLELIQDESKDGEFSKFVRKKGDGIHHIAFLTDDIENDIEVLKRRGVEMVDQKPKIGVRGKKIAFTKESALNGIPFELSEP